VIAALDQKSGTIPFRSSVLTNILSPCLSGDGKTMMIVTLSSDHDDAQSSLESLKFAKQVNSIELGKPKKNVKEAGPKGTLMTRGRNNSQ